VTSLLGEMYLGGLISYPRTENRAFNNYQQVLKQVSKIYENHFNVKAVHPLLQKQDLLTDHAPIVPLKDIESVVQGPKRKVYVTLFDHLKKVLSGPNRYKRYHYEIRRNEIIKKISFLKIVEKNFEDDLQGHAQLPQGSFSLDTQTVEVRTKAPSYYTAATLLKKMAILKIGTKSTRTNIIENLSNYQDEGSHDLWILESFL